MTSARILVVDDEEMNLRLLRRILERDGYTNIRTTSVGQEVLQIVAEYNPDLVLLDLHMPPPDGFAILRSLAPRLTGAGYLPVLVLTGDGSSESKRGALSTGARDFLSKPFDGTEVLLRIRNLLETRFLYQTLETQNALLETRVEARMSELQRSQAEILERLARAAEIRDDDTGRHTQRVGDLSALLAQTLDMGSRTTDLVKRASPLHDVGKIGIPDSILLKPGALTEDETLIMRTHTVIGAQILSGGQSELMIVAERIALNHHERWDGKGYPNNIAGSAIPVEARIVAVADCVDALTHARPYRPAWLVPDVLEKVQSEGGTHFDPEIVDALLRSGFLRNLTVTPPFPVPAIDEQRRQMSDIRGRGIVGSQRGRDKIPPRALDLP